MNYSGWLLDLYEDAEHGLALWLMDENGQRRKFIQPFPITLYAAGPNPRLRLLWQYLQGAAIHGAAIHGAAIHGAAIHGAAIHGVQVNLARTERFELFAGRPIVVMAITAQGPVQAKRLFWDISASFPDLTYYDADLSPNLRHAALYGTFPLARVNIDADADEGEAGQGLLVHAIQTCDSPWELEHSPAPLRVMTLTPDANPSRRQPRSVRITTSHPVLSWELPLEPVRPFLVNLAALLRRYDPDLILSSWGDTWLVPRLLELAKGASIPLHLSRDHERGVGRKKARSYLTYGQMMHVGQQMRLFGRLHIDIFNAMMFHDYGLDGILESSRVTALPIQTSARCSPGSGISAMQVTVALRKEILVPWRKQAAEKLKSARDLIEADIGGLVYAPLLGLHSDVAELDFTSLYPACITTGHLSPELMNNAAPNAEKVPGTNLTVDRSQEGLIPATIDPLLQKRIALKTQIARLPAWDPRRAVYKAQASAQKWLLVTCFGYLGYKNARFGRIEAHMATTACGREALMRAKETAEDMGFRVLGLYVDAIWVTQDGYRDPQDFQPLLDEITVRTHLPITLEGVYKWLAFLPAKGDLTLSVANRYFGAFQDGSTKVRGIELRRRDTPAFIAKMQEELIQAMSKADSAEDLPRMLPDLVAFLRSKIRDLYAGKIPLEDLVVIQKLSREIEKYKSPSPAAVAARQMAQAGKMPQPGERVYLLYTRGDPGARAWYLPGPVEPSTLDLARYRTLLIRAAWSVLGPLGVSEEVFTSWVINDAAYRLADSPLPCCKPPLLIEARRKQAALLKGKLQRWLAQRRIAASIESGSDTGFAAD